MALDIEATEVSLFGNIKREAEKLKKDITLSLQQEEKSILEINNLTNVNASQTSSELETNRKQILTESESSSHKPKWQNLDKVTVLLSTEQKEGLDRLAKKIMKYRSSITKGNLDKERITANTLIRVLVDVFLERENQLEMEVIADEEAVCKWIEKLFILNS
jgi:putative protein kinase ArgK-like GTPase of G3E family